MINFYFELKMHKCLISLFLLLPISSFASLYLTTEYQEGQKPKIVSKHHIFLNKPYTVRYTFKKYILNLKKISPKNAEIEIDSYNLDNRGGSEMVAGKIGNFEIGKTFVMTDKATDQRPKFFFKVYLDKYFPVK